MADGPEQPQSHRGSQVPPAVDRRAQYIGVGCLSLIAGTCSGGMLGVGLSQIVDKVTRCVPTEGTPACEWTLYAAIGMLIGALTLPALTLTRVWKNSRADRNSE